MEWLEDMRDIGCGNAQTRVAYAHDGKGSAILLLPLKLNVDLSSVGRIFDGIGKQICQDAFQAHAVNPTWQALFPRRKGNLMGRGLLGLCHYLAYQRHQVDIAPGQLQWLIGLHVRKVEQFVDLRAHARRDRINAFE